MICGKFRQWLLRIGVGEGGGEMELKPVIEIDRINVPIIELA